MFAVVDELEFYITQYMKKNTLSEITQEISGSKWQEDLRFLQKTVLDDYPFLLKKISKADFNKEVDTLYDNIPQLQEHEIEVGLARIISSFKYGHTALGLRLKPQPYRQLPIELKYFKDGIYVQGIAKQYKAALGAKVIGIGKTPIEKALDLIYPAVPVENTQFFRAYGLGYLRYPKILHAQRIVDTFSDTIEFQLSKNAKKYIVPITSLPTGEFISSKFGYILENENYLDARNTDTTPLYLKNFGRNYYFEHLHNQNAVYIKQSQMLHDPEEDIPTFYARVFDYIHKHEVEKLIIDVRLNSGGDNRNNKPIITGILGNSTINKVGNLFIIIGDRTFSACQNLVNELDKYTNAIFVGEPTAENINFYGDSRKVVLPNSQIPIYLSYAWWQDRPEWINNKWLAPHISVQNSFTDYVNNKDVVLDAIFNFKNPDLIIRPMPYLAKLFNSGKIGVFKSEARRLVPLSQYNFEELYLRLVRFGQVFYDTEQYDNASIVFNLIDELYSNNKESKTYLEKIRNKNNVSQ